MMNSQARTLISGCLISAISATFFLVLPVAIGALSNEASYGEQFLGLIATTYLLSFTIAGIVSAAISPKANQRLISLAGFLLLIGGFLSASFSTLDKNLLLGGFAAAGVGAGVLYSVSFRVIGLVANLERAYGLKLFSEQILGAAMFFTFTYLGLSFSVLMKSIAGIALLFLIVIAITPRLAFIEPNSSNANVSDSKTISIFVSIAAVILFMFAMTGPWTFLEPLSQDRNMGSKLFGTLGAISLVLGGVGGGIAAIQGNRFGLYKPLYLAGLIALVIYGALMYFELPGLIIFILIFPLLWNYALAYQFSIASYLDKQNRFTGWLAPAVAIGATGGPIFAGTLLEQSSTSFTMLLTAGLLSAFALILSAQSVRSNSR